MAKRITPAMRVRAEVDEVFATGAPLNVILERVGQLMVGLTLQVAVEAEVAAFLERAPHERRDDDSPAGSRNGRQPPSTIKTTMGPITVQRPKLRDADEKFCSQLFGSGVTRTNALEALVISLWVRGLSDRDVEAALAEALGLEATLSKSTVSRICQAIKDEFDAWKTRDLSDIDLEYLFLDGSHFKMHDGAAAEPILAAWGITTLGKAVFIGLGPASSESGDAWDEFLDDLRARGLRDPLLVITDGGSGLLSSIEVTYEKSLKQRCLIHRVRNILAKVSKVDQDEVKGDYWKTWNDIEVDAGEPALAVARQRAEDFANKWQQRYPSAVACVTDDFMSLAVHLRFPKEHWNRIRHSNLIERTFGESRRRVKVIGRLPGETTCLSLVWAVLDRSCRKWRGVDMNPRATQHLGELRRALFARSRQEPANVNALRPLT